MTNIKEKINEKKVAINRAVGGTALAVPAVIASATPAFASSSNDTVNNLTAGMSGFIGLVTSMVDTIMGSPTLQIAFAASFAFLAVRMVRKLKKN